MESTRMKSKWHRLGDTIRHALEANMMLCVIAIVCLLMFFMVPLLVKVFPDISSVMIAVFSVLFSGIISTLASSVSHRSTLKQHVLTAMDHLDTISTDTYAIWQRIQIDIDSVDHKGIK